MTRWPALAAAILLTAGPAGAQPPFLDERNWTVDGGGGRRHGVSDIVSVESGSRVTQVWVGFHLIEPSKPSGRWVLDLLPVAALLGVREGHYWLRGEAVWPAGRN